MKRGFTLIEVIIAVSLFAIIIALAAGGFVNALHAQREASALIAAQSNASLVLEQMAREVRTGYLFCHGLDGSVTCTGPSCGGGGGNEWTCNNLNFENAELANVTYSLAGQTLQKSENGGTPQPLTGNNVAVKYLQFVLFGNVVGDCWNPRITISMGIAPSSSDPSITNNTLNLQTTVSAREPDSLNGGYCP